MSKINRKINEELNLIHADERLLQNAVSGAQKPVLAPARRRFSPHPIYALTAAMLVIVVGAVAFLGGGLGEYLPGAGGSEDFEPCCTCEDMSDPVGLISLELASRDRDMDRLFVDYMIYSYNSDVADSYFYNAADRVPELTMWLEGLSLEHEKLPDDFFHGDNIEERWYFFRYELSYADTADNEIWSGIELDKRENSTIYVQMFSYFEVSGEYYLIYSSPVCRTTQSYRVLNPSDPPLGEPTKGVPLGDVISLEPDAPHLEIIRLQKELTELPAIQIIHSEFYENGHGFIDIIPVVAGGKWFGTGTIFEVTYGMYSLSEWLGGLQIDWENPYNFQGKQLQGKIPISDMPKTEEAWSFYSELFGDIEDVNEFVNKEIETGMFSYVNTEDGSYLILPNYEYYLKVLNPSDPPFVGSAIQGDASLYKRIADFTGTPGTYHICRAEDEICADYDDPTGQTAILFAEWVDSLGLFDGGAVNTTLYFNFNNFNNEYADFLAGLDIEFSYAIPVEECSNSYQPVMKYGKNQYGQYFFIFIEYDDYRADMQWTFMVSNPSNPPISPDIPAIATYTDPLATPPADGYDMRTTDIND
jgi:hypothetical protein